MTEEIDFLPRSNYVLGFEGDKEIKEKFFYSARSFRKALIMTKYNFPFSIDAIVEHESAHVEEARKRGYMAEYGLIYNGKDFLPCARLNNGNPREIPVDDLISIISAPRFLGASDKLMLNSLETWKKATRGFRRNIS